MKLYTALCVLAFAVGCCIGCGTAPETVIIIDGPDVFECDYLDPDGCVRHINLTSEEHPDPPQELGHRLRQALAVYGIDGGFPDVMILKPGDDDK